MKRLLLAVSVAAFAGLPSVACAEAWVGVSSDGDRFIRADVLRADLERTNVFYVVKYRSPTSEYNQSVRVDCAQRLRGEGAAAISGGNPAYLIPFSSLDRSVRQEVDFACRWANSDPDAIATVEAAKSEQRPVRPFPSPPATQPPAPPIAGREPPRTQSPTPPTRVSSGSGFVVASSQVVTNHHVIEACRLVGVRQDDQTRGAAVIAAHQGTDLALLQLDGPLGTAAPVRLSVALGEEVMVAGHPLSSVLSSDLVVTSGQVNALSGVASDPTVFQLSAGVHSGNSGGPVLDRTGAIVGVVVAKIDALKFGRATGELPQNVNFAIKPEVLRLFLDTHRVRYQTPQTGGKRLEGSELATRARAMTVQVICAG